MESIGETLREARQAKKKSLEDVSRTTKIKVDILEKLEANDFATMSGPMYTKGFIKLYAEHLGLDGASIVAAYLRSQGGLRRQGLHIETEVQISSRRKRELNLPIAGVIRVVAAVTVVVLVVMTIHHFTSRHATTPTPVTAVAAPVPTPAPALTSASAKTVTLPTVDFDDVYYQPKQSPPAEVLELPK